VTQLDSFCAHSIVEPDPCRSSCPEDPATTSLARATTTHPDGHGPMEGPSSLLLSSTVTTQDFSKVQRASPNPCVSVPTLAPRSSTLGDSTLWRAYKPHSCDLGCLLPIFGGGRDHEDALLFRSHQQTLSKPTSRRKGLPDTPDSLWGISIPPVRGVRSATRCPRSCHEATSIDWQKKRSRSSALKRFLGPTYLHGSQRSEARVTNFVLIPL